MSDDTNLSASPSPECELVEGRLADYLDDAPDPALVAEVDAHLARCRRCAALVGDLAGITTAARTLPPLEPSRDLWTGIAERIAAAPTVVPIETARRGRGFALPARWRSLGAAAALVLVTAGVTYTVTRISLYGGDTKATTVATTASPTSPTTRAADSGQPATPTGEQLAVSGAPTTPGTTTATSTERVARGVTRSGDTKLVAGSSRPPQLGHDVSCAAAKASHLVHRCSTTERTTVGSRPSTVRTDRRRS